MLIEILRTSFNAVCPILLLLILGFVLKRTGFLSESFDKTGNKLVFNVCLPAMIFLNIYDIENVAEIPWNLIWYCTGAVTALFFLGMLVAVLTTPVPQRRGVIMQCVFRSNFAIIGIPLANILGGQAATTVASVILAFTIPAFNLFAVLALSVFLRGEDGTKPSGKKVIRTICTNPLIVAAALAFVCHGLRLAQISVWGSPALLLQRDVKFVYTTLTFLNNAATPLALLVMGSQFTFAAVKSLRKEIIVATVFRLLIAPIVGVGGAWLLSTYTNWLSLSTADYPALICLFGTPVAVSSAIMAAGMKNDTQLATQLVVWTSLLSLVTLFAFFCIMMSMGLLAV